MFIEYLRFVWKILKCTQILFGMRYYLGSYKSMVFLYIGMDCKTKCNCLGSKNMWKTKIHFAPIKVEINFSLHRTLEFIRILGMWVVKKSKSWYNDNKEKQIRAYGGELYCVNSSKRSAQGNVVVIEGDMIKEYGGGWHCCIINCTRKKGKEVSIDWNSLAILSECGKNVDEYVSEMQECDCCWDRWINSLH